MIKAIIIDDEPSAIEIIETLIAEYFPDISVCDTCNDVKEAKSSIYRFLPDIIFLDIELANGSGFEVLDSFSDLHAHVIFTTAYEQYAINAIKHHAYGYLLKPLVPLEFEQLVKSVLFDIGKQKIISKNTYATALQPLPYKIALPDRTGVDYYSLTDIVCIEGQGSYSMVHLRTGGQLTVTKIIKEFEHSLADKGFLRVHKSFLINIAHIIAHKKEGNGILIMSNRMEIPISAKEKANILYTIKKHSNIIY